MENLENPFRQPETRAKKRLFKAGEKPKIEATKVTKEKVEQVKVKYGSFEILVQQVKFLRAVERLISLAVLVEKKKSAQELVIEAVGSVDEEGNILKLNLNDLYLTKLPVLPPQLQELSCFNNRLAVLPELPKVLLKLNCRDNKLESLPELPSGLQVLSCNYNKLSNLPTLPKALTKLNCWDNRLTVLPELPPALIQIDCSKNKLRELPALPLNLKELHCTHNKLSSLPTLPEGLSQLFCSKNSIITLPKLPEALIRLHCNHNQLTSLPVFPSKLKQLICVGNNFPLKEIAKIKLWKTKKTFLT